MNLGAHLRRSSISRARVTGLLSTTALLCVAIGSLGAGVASASGPYPPSPPCSLSWSQDGAHRSVLVGSGYDTNQSVAVTLYPQAQSLGSYATNSNGAFAATIDMSRSRAASWVTASSVNRSCSVVPPRGTSPTATPTGAPSSGASTTAPGGGTSSAGGGSSSSSTRSAGSSSTNSGGSTGNGSNGNGTGNGSNGNGTGNGGNGNGTNGGGTNGGGPATSGSNYPPTSGQSTSGAGSGTSPSTPGGSTVPSRPGNGSPSGPIDSLKSPSALGLPLAVVVIIAVILLLAGGLGVLILTRRSG